MAVQALTVEPLQSGGMSNATMMYADRYFVAGKCLHGLAIKARGRIEQTEKMREGQGGERKGKKRKRGGGAEKER